MFFNQAASVMALLPPYFASMNQTPQTPIKTDLAYVAKYDGTATTTLFGENMDASFWAQFDPNAPSRLPLFPMIIIRLVP